MQIKEAVSANYTNVFKDHSESDQRAQIKSIQYLLGLANQTGVDIGDWDLFETFGNGDGKIYVMKSALNERFFKKVDTLPKKEETPEELTKVQPELVAYLANHAEKIKREKIAGIERNKQYSIQNAQNYYSNYESYMRNARAYQVEIETLGEKPAPDSTVPAEIAKVIKAGFWQLEAFALTDKKLTFKTKKDVFASHTNKSAGVDVTVNFGLFQCDIYIETAALRVLPVGNNINVNGYYHPHISDSYVCWGNAKDMVNRDLPKMKLSSVLEALAIILTQYNAASPYISIEQFAAKQREGKRSGASDPLIEEEEEMLYCNDCDEHYSDGERCACRTCDQCGEEYNASDTHVCDSMGDEISGHVSTRVNDENDPLHLMRVFTADRNDGTPLNAFRYDAYGAGDFYRTTSRALERRFRTWNDRGRLTQEIRDFVEQAQAYFNCLKDNGNRREIYANQLAAGAAAVASVRATQTARSVAEVNRLVAMATNVGNWELAIDEVTRPRRRARINPDGSPRLYADSEGSSF